MERRWMIGEVMRAGGPGSPEETIRWRPEPELAAAEQGASREHLVDTLGELLSATPDQVDELIERLRDELSRASSVGSPDAFERGLELGLLVGLGSREAARRVLAGD
jgi:hypothetical protein